MLPTDLLPKAQQIIARLSAIDYENPKICEQRIREAFSRHLTALNLRDRPVEVYHSFYAALDAARKVVFDAERDAAFKTAREAVNAALFEAVKKAADDATNYFMSDVAMEAARKVVFDAERDAAFETVQEAASDAALRAVNKTASDPLWNAAWNDGFQVVLDRAWNATGDAAEFRAEWKRASDYASDQAFKYALEAVIDTTRSVHDAARVWARNAALMVAWDGDWNVMRETAQDTEIVVEMAVKSVNCTTSSPQHEQLCAVWMPFVDAVEAGLFCFWVTTTKVIALTLPVMRIQDYRLHADGQPAVQWSDSECYYFWRGLQIPQKYGAVLSKNWRSQWLLEEPNAELRRVLIQGIGYDRIVQELGAVELDTWREYSLLKIQAIDIYLLKMTCPSTNHVHILRTPPFSSAREAIAWCNWDVDPEAFSAET
jgi:hypothetical protein